MSDYLAKYNPQTAIFSQFEIDGSLDKKTKSFKTWEALLSAKRNHDGLFLVIGKLLKDVRDNRMYEDLDYETFSQFLEDERLSFSREKAYMCIKTFEYYIEYLQLDPESVGQMNVSRLSQMVPVLKQIEDKTEVVKQIEEFNSLRGNDFVREIKNRTNRAGKPSVYFSEEAGKWIVNYHSNTTLLHDLGEFVTVIDAVVQNTESS